LANLLANVAIAFMVLRFGLLSLVAEVFVGNLMSNLQPTLNFSAWYAWNSVLPIALVVALAVWACYTSLGGQRIWKQDWLET
jgi:hypothetical protein